MWMHPEKYLVYSEVRNLTYTTHSPEETEKLGEAIAQRLSGGEVLALFGGMGMGKTALTRGLARGLGVEAGVSSPTFALVNQYDTAGGRPVFHFDFYRIDRIEEAYDFGYEEYFYSGNLCLVEWPEKIEELLPDDTMTVRIRVDGPEQRTLFID